jgi:lipopolysaccharide heptosyltransferase II
VIKSVCVGAPQLTDFADDIYLLASSGERNGGGYLDISHNEEVPLLRAPLMKSLGLNQKLLFDHYVGGVIAWCLNAAARLAALVWSRDHSLSRDPKAVLFIKFLGLGSVVRASSLFVAVKQRYPNTKIYFAAFPGMASVVRMYSEVDEVVVVRDDSLIHLIVDTLSLIVWCWRKRIDLVIDLEFHSKYSSVVSALSLALNRAGFAGVTSRFRRGLYTHLVFWNPTRFVGRAYAQLGAALGLPDAEDAQLVISPEAEREASALLESLGCTAHTRLVGLNPNASDLRLERRWPAEYFAEVARQLPTGHHFAILVCGAQSEWSTAEEVRAGCVPGNYPVHNIAGKLSFAGMCALLRKVSVFVTNDSGPMHVARAFSIPTVSLWGPTHPANYSPRGGRHISIYQPIYCSPCTHATDVPPCMGDNQCMKRIEPTRVLKAVCKLLDIEAPAHTSQSLLRENSEIVLGYWQRASVAPPKKRGEK